MKNSLKFICLTVVSFLYLSACTFGDKGSERVPDSVRIDTSLQSSPSSGAMGTGINPSAPVNTGKGTIMNDTMKSDSTTKKDQP